LYDDIDIVPPPPPSDTKQQSAKKGFLKRLFGRKKKSADEIIASLESVGDTKSDTKPSVDDIQAIRNRLGLDGTSGSVDKLREQLDAEKDATVDEEIARYEKEQEEYEHSLDEIAQEHEREAKAIFASTSKDASSVQETTPKAESDATLNKATTVDAQATAQPTVQHDMSKTNENDSVSPWTDFDLSDEKARAASPEDDLPVFSAPKMPDNSLTPADDAPLTATSSKESINDAQDTVHDTTQQLSSNVAKDTTPKPIKGVDDGAAAVVATDTPLQEDISTVAKDVVAKSVTKSLDSKEKTTQASSDKNESTKKKTAASKQSDKQEKKSIAQKKSSLQKESRLSPEVLRIKKREEELRKLEEKLSKQQQEISEQQKKMKEKEKDLARLEKEKKDLVLKAQALKKEQEKKQQQIAKQAEQAAEKLREVTQQEKSMLTKEKTLQAKEQELAKESQQVAKELSLVEQQQEDYKKRMVSLDNQLNVHKKDIQQLTKQKDDFTNYRSKQELLIAQAKDELAKVRDELYDRLVGYEEVVKEREEDLAIREDAFAEWSPRIQKEADVSKELRLKQEDVLRRLAENESLFKQLSLPPKLLDGEASTTIIKQESSDIADLIDFAKKLLDQGDILDAKLQYNEIREKFLTADVSEFKKRDYSRQLKDLYEQIHLRLLEEEAREALLDAK